MYSCYQNSLKLNENKIYSIVVLNFIIPLERSFMTKQIKNTLNESLEVLVQRFYKAFIENNIEILFYTVYLTTIILVG
jgi:hypothetical protein